MKSTRVALSIIVAMVGGVSARAASLDQIKSEIVGKQNREWIVHDRIVFKGGSKQCAAGDTYRFAVDGTAVESRCLDGKFSVTKSNWTLNNIGGDVIMSLGGRDYNVTFGKSDGARAMRLQSVEPGPHAKVSAITEIYMRPTGK